MHYGISFLFRPAAYGMRKAAAWSAQPSLHA